MLRRRSTKPAIQVREALSRNRKVRLRGRRIRVSTWQDWAIYVEELPLIGLDRLLGRATCTIFAPAWEMATVGMEFLPGNLLQRMNFSYNDNYTEAVNKMNRGLQQAIRFVRLQWSRPPERNEVREVTTLKPWYPQIKLEVVDPSLVEP